MEQNKRAIWGCFSGTGIQTVFICAALLIGFFSFNLMAADMGMQKLFVGSYSPADEAGIKCYEFDPLNGKLTFLSGTSGIENPSFLAVHSNGRFLYAVSETDNRGSNSSGGVAAYRIVSDKGELEKLNEVTSGGAAPCHISLDRSEQMLMTANYNGGSIAAFPVLEDGSLGGMSSFDQHTGSSVNPTRQNIPHAHSINSSPDNRFALVPDLGLDKVFVYRLDPEKKSLEKNDPPYATVPGGSGPRHLTFHPNGSVVYVINEMASTVTVFSYQAKEGTLQAIQSVSTRPEGFEGRNSTAEVVVDPSGRYLYGSNRGHDSIAVFSIDQDTGKLEVVQHRRTGGRTPRNFCLSPDGKFLLAANQRSDNLLVFPLDEASGEILDPVEKISLKAPVCIRFMK
ncbi:MAG: lactonase family protein [Acidobacteriota bacterium]